MLLQMHKEKVLKKIVYSALSALIMSALSSQVAMAGDVAAFDIEVVNATSDTFTKGPFAVSISNGQSPKVNSIIFKNDAFSFLSIAPHQFDSGNHKYYIDHCYDRFDDQVCDGLWHGSNLGAQWRTDSVYYVKQERSIVNSNVTDENEIIYKQIDESGQGVGKIVTDNIMRYGYHQTLGIAKLDNKTFYLTSPYDDVVENEQKYGNFAEAYSFIKLEDGRYLVGGYSYNGKFDYNAYANCYGGDLNPDYGDYLNCPGFRTQATIWVIDPNTQNDGDTIKGIQPNEYIDADNDEHLVFGNIRGFINLNNNIIAYGYSSSDKRGGAFYQAWSVATYWPLNVTKTEVSFKNKGDTIAGMDMPGHGSEDYAYTDLVSVSSNGYIVTNVKLTSSENSNYAKNYGYSKFKLTTKEGEETATISTDNVRYPLHNNPIKGANSEGWSVNAQGFVVGWRDNRTEKTPVNYAISRVQEGFIHNINDNTTYYLSDLICSNANNEKKCGSEGKYYNIRWGVQINDDNVILASGFEYPDLDSFNNQKNSKIVTLLLKPNESTFITKTNEDGSSYKTINSDLVVENNNVQQNTDSNENNSRGSFGIFGLMVTLFSVFIFRRKENC